MKRQTFLLTLWAFFISLFSNFFSIKSVEISKDDITNKTYEEFWKPIVEKNGVVDFEQVKKELQDYRILLENVPKVYCEVTGGKLSYANYSAETIIQEYEDHLNEQIDFWSKEAVNDFKENQRANGVVLVNV